MKVKDLLKFNPESEILIQSYWVPGVCCRVENPIENKDFGLILHCLTGKENIVIEGEKDTIGVEIMEMLKMAMDYKDWA